MLLFCSSVPTEISLRRWGLAKAFSPSFSRIFFFVSVAVKMGCVVLTCSITALLGNAVLSFSLSFSGLCGCVWPSACNLITQLMLGAGASSAPPPRATCAAKTWACRVFSGAGWQRNACSCLFPACSLLVLARHSCQVCVTRGFIWDPCCSAPVQ